ncbi:MAG: hypothetical protein FWG20_02205 [Candidatus Cloacimonetes bacterium]|nr:hypothetical protein [Candidatus Cloacimonadota bacterium]
MSQRICILIVLLLTLFSCDSSTKLKDLTLPVTTLTIKNSTSADILYGCIGIGGGLNIDPNNPNKFVCTRKFLNILTNPILAIPPGKEQKVSINSLDADDHIASEAGVPSGLYGITAFTANFSYGFGDVFLITEGKKITFTDRDKMDINPETLEIIMNLF